MSQTNPSQTYFLTPALTLWKREVIRFLRQRNRIIGALATPLVFWFFIGSGLGPSFQMPNTPETMSYLEYFFPGTLVLIMLFTAIFSTISIIEDRREGFLQSVLVAPVSPGSIVMGKFLGGTTMATLQGLFFLILAPLIGMHIPWIQLPLIILVFALVGFGLTGLGFLVAWPMDSTQGFHAIMNVFLMPLWLMSGALFPAPDPGSWVHYAVLLNPVTYCVSATRSVLYHGDPGVINLPPTTTSILICAAFAAIMYALSYRLVASRKKVTG